jgi:hypothetical protein
MQAYIKIQVSSVDLHVNHSAESSGATLLVKGRLARGTTIRTKGDRDLSSAPWSFLIVPMGSISAAAKESGGVGLCSFLDDFDDPDYGYEASFDGHIGMDAAEQQALISAWLAGKRFSRMTVAVEGLEYGWEPDGSSKVWDEKSPHRTVAGSSFEILDPAPAKPDQDEPVTHAADPALTPRDLDPLFKQLKELSSTALFILGAVVVGLGIVIFR